MDNVIWHDIIWLPKNFLVYIDNKYKEFKKTRSG